MKKIISALALLLVCALSYSQDTVEKWGRFEFSCRAAVKSNPFDVKFSATFTNGSETKTVRGFYDGNDTFVVRFMPGSEGTWNYVTASNVPALNRKKGSFVCTPALEGNHGPVEIDGLHIDDSAVTGDYDGPFLFSSFGRDVTEEGLIPFPAEGEIKLSGITTASGKPLRISPNEALFSGMTELHP